MLNSVAQGEGAIGPTFESKAYAYVAGGQKEIKLDYAEDGTCVTDKTVVLVKNASNDVAARALYDTLLSEEMQIELLGGRSAARAAPTSKSASMPNSRTSRASRSSRSTSRSRKAKRYDFLAQWVQLHAN